MSKTVIIPWKKTCALRPEIRERQLAASDFAVDLHKVVNGWPGGNPPFYCDPGPFFSTTYATANLVQFCKVVLRRLSGKDGGEAVINVAQTFGGGKSHTLTALYYLATAGKKLPKHETSVKAILNAAGLKDSPRARVAAVSFDKVDWVRGCEVASPSGEVRAFRMPWNLIAWQLLGQAGLDILARDEDKPDHNTPPADTLWAKILHTVEAEGGAALILLDEFLMWAHDAASPGTEGSASDRGPAWYDRLKNFFQRLTQAVESSQRSGLVVSLLATDPQKNDETGKSILSACNHGLNRQASLQSPVEKDDLAELLRRRMFVTYPENRAERDAIVQAFWPNFQKVEAGRAKTPGARERIADAYPFHPDLLDRFFGKWTELSQFQRTRGVLQTFALALRDAEAWDEAPLVGAQVFLAEPGKDGLSDALLKLAEIAKDSDRIKNPQWPTNLKTELPRALGAQRIDAATLSGREIEAACVAAFIYSQPIGEQAELGDLRWLVCATVEMPAVLNNGLAAWSKTSWYLEECEATEAGTGVPKYWRLGPKPNLNQLHDSFKRQALKHARTQFDELARNKCQPLYEGCLEAGVKLHKLPANPAEVDDNGEFRLVLLGAAFEGVPGAPPKKDAADFLRTHSSPTDTRMFQNIVLVATPSASGLRTAEEQVANWMAWQEIESSSQFKELESTTQQMVRNRQREAFKDAATAVKNAYELVLYVDKAGAVQVRKVTMGAQSLLDTLKQEKELRIFDEKIDASAILPGGPYPVWPAGAAAVPVGDLYQEFGRHPGLPKLLRVKTVENSIEDAVRRGLLALRCPRADGSEAWFWRCPIDMAGWASIGEAWLPERANIRAPQAAVVAPGALPGLWPADESGTNLATLCSWFDGKHAFFEVTGPGYPPESRPIPAAESAAVIDAVARSVEMGAAWLVFGNESLIQERPSNLQLDPAALILAPPKVLSAIDLLPANLPAAWQNGTQSTPGELYAALKAREGKPWPVTRFLAVLNAALAQGFAKRATGDGPLRSLVDDAGVALVLRADAPSPPPTQPDPLPTGGRRASNLAKLSAAEVQDLADRISDLTKALAGADPEIEVRLTMRSSATIPTAEVTRILKEIHPDWQM